MHGSTLIDGLALVDITARTLGLTRSDIVGWRHTLEVAFARKVVMFLAHERLGATLKEAGWLVGRHYTTAQRAVQHVLWLQAYGDPLIDGLVRVERALDDYLEN